jgi:hypothetical protein
MIRWLTWRGFTRAELSRPGKEEAAYTCFGADGSSLGRKRPKGLSYT